MSSPGTFSIFVSAVSGELGSYREEVARVLRRKGLEVREEKHFRQGAETLLELLRDYIQRCDAVILLVGDRCGSMVTAEHAEALGELPVYQTYKQRTGNSLASYTQWEFFLAKQFGKEMYVYFTGSGCVPDEANAEDAGQQAHQRAFRDWVEATGKHREPLTTKAKLIEDVLVQDFPDLGRPKPIALPYPSLQNLFLGRDSFVADLRKTLRQPGDGHATAITGKAVHGLGGVGKTRLAVEYAWRQGEEYTALLFAGADSPEKLRRNLAAFCGAQVLDLSEQAVAEEERQVAAVLHWLQKHPGWLLILDNADTQPAAEAVQRLLAQLHGGHVLITSRRSNWSGPVESMELDLLSPQASEEFLLARTDRAKGRRKTADDPAQARKLADELGHLALALEQAGAYISQRRLTFAEYLEEWRTHRDRVLEWYDKDLMQYPASVAVTWQTSVDQLKPAARQLLNRLAWLAPDPILESLLDVPVPEATASQKIFNGTDGNQGTDRIDESSKSHQSPDSHKSQPSPEPAHLRDALADLEAYSLVSRSAETPTFTVHRLVQDVTRRSQRDETPSRHLISALHWINAAFDGDPSDVRTWPTLNPLASHARSVAEQADQAKIAEPTARLLNQLGLLLKTKALHKEAEPLYRRALAIDEQTYGKEHPEVAIDLNNLAQLLKATNRLAEAEPLMRRALAIDEQSYGKEHPKVAIRLNNLALLFQATNRLAEAEPLMCRALAIDEQSYGKEHHDVAIDLNNLAALYYSTNRLAEAEPLMRRALDIRKVSLGEKHPDYGTSLNDLGNLLRLTNRMEEAEPLLRQVAVIYEDSFGQDHPWLATSLNNLALLLKATNRLAEAEPLMWRAVGIFEGSLGQDHPHTKKVAGNLELLLEALAAGRGEG